jgi:hypothetical protein
MNAWIDHHRAFSVLIYLKKRLNEKPMRSQSQFKVGLEQEENGRWIAEVSPLPRIMAYGSSGEE